MSSNNPGCLSSFLRMFGLGSKPASTPVEAPAPEPLPFKLRDDFFTPPEASFFRVLSGLIQGRQLICPKVGLSDIFFVSQPNQNMAFFNKINRKHVDFLLCDPQTLRPTLAIELDDSSHQRPDRVERDKFVDEVFATAGLPLVHVPTRPAYSTQELADLLKSAFAPQKVSQSEPIPAQAEPPLCPRCSAQMVLRTAQRGRNAGQQFYGCPNYPRCQTVLPISESAPNRAPLGTE